MQYISEWCGSLSSHYQDSQSARMNEVMFTLTLVTTVFIPAQVTEGIVSRNALASWLFALLSPLSDAFTLAQCVLCLFSQFFSSVYGMNFEDMPELEWVSETHTPAWCCCRPMSRLYSWPARLWFIFVLFCVFSTRRTTRIGCSGWQAQASRSGL